jgi:hypothetical protein
MKRIRRRRKKKSRVKTPKRRAKRQKLKRFSPKRKSRKRIILLEGAFRLMKTSWPNLNQQLRSKIL